jgi:esterase/lipase superfamily enzyme
MHGSHRVWWSPAVERHMHVRWFGWGGARVIAFPTTWGSHNEWPDRGMPSVLGEHIERGWLTLFCVDANHDASWYDKRLPVSERARRHLRYDAYLRDELLPFTAHVDGNPFVIATGASFGAYHAACFGLRHPHLVHRIIGMSGLYDIRSVTGGRGDDPVYWCNPADFMRNEWEQERLDAFRRQDIILAIGRDDPNYSDNAEFSATLWRKGIGNALRVWDGMAHDWPFWEKMIRLYIGGHD